MQGGPAGSLFSVSDSGWMEAANFKQWFEKMFVPAVKHLTASFPVVLIFDGHHSHISIELIDIARRSNVHLLCLPPHSTHLLQPLDVGVFGPVKATWKKLLKEHQIETCAGTVTKEDFPSLIKRLWEQSFLSAHLRSGFQKTGLHPLSRDAIPASRLSKSLPFQRDTASACASSTSKPPETIEIHATGSLTFGGTTTPIRLHLRGYFSKLLQKKREKPVKAGDKCKAKPHFYGEALTLDEVKERYEQAQAEKQRKPEKVLALKLQKRRLQEEEVPNPRRNQSSKMPMMMMVQQITVMRKLAAKDAKRYMILTMKKRKVAMWVGCDNCWRWYHFACAGLSVLPAEEDYWSCPKCK